MDSMAGTDRVYLSVFVMGKLYYGFEAGDRSIDNRKGTPLAINDVWIAAHCIESGTVLVSLDRHFLEVPGLRTWPPLRQRT